MPDVTEEEIKKRVANAFVGGFLICFLFIATIIVAFVAGMLLR
jgi:hypothetical protein